MTVSYLLYLTQLYQVIRLYNVANQGKTILWYSAKMINSLSLTYFGNCLFRDFNTVLHIVYEVISSPP
jgi:hypothetical protein